MLDDLRAGKFYTAGKVWLELLGVDGLGAIKALPPFDAFWVGGVHMCTAVKIKPASPFGLIDQPRYVFVVAFVCVGRPDFSIVAWQ